MESGSDRSCDKWRRDYQIDGNEQLQLHHFYRAMYWLGEPLYLSKDQDGIIPFIRRCTKDVIEEKVTPGQAREEYGVVIAEDDLEIDHSATQILRKRKTLNRKGKEVGK